MVSFETVSPFHISSSISRPVTPLRRGSDIYSASDSLVGPHRVWTPSPSPTLSVGTRSPVNHEYHVSVENSRLYDYQAPVPPLNPRWTVTAADTPKWLTSVGALSSLSPRKVEPVKATGLTSPAGFSKAFSGGPALPGAHSPSPSSSKRWIFAARAAFRQHKVRVERELELIENYDGPVFVFVSRRPVGLRSAMRAGKPSHMRESAKRVQFARTTTVSIFSPDNPPLSLKSCDGLLQGDPPCSQKPASIVGVEQPLRCEQQESLQKRPSTPVPSTVKGTGSEQPSRREQDGSLQMRPATPVPTGRGGHQLPAPSASLPATVSAPPVLSASYPPAQPFTPREEGSASYKDRRSGYVVPSLRPCTPPNRPSSSAIITPPASVRRDARPAPLRLPAGGRQLPTRAPLAVSARTELSIVCHPTPPLLRDEPQHEDGSIISPATSPLGVPADPESPVTRRKRTTPKISSSQKKSCRAAEEDVETPVIAKAKKKSIRQPGADVSSQSTAGLTPDEKRDKPRKKLQKKEGKHSAGDAALFTEVIGDTRENDSAGSSEASPVVASPCLEARTRGPGGANDPRADGSLAALPPLSKHESRSCKTKPRKGSGSPNVQKES